MTGFLQCRGETLWGHSPAISVSGSPLMLAEGDTAKVTVTDQK